MRRALCLGLLLGSATALAQNIGRLIDFVEVTESDRHVNVQLQFNCTARFLTQTPLDAGSEATFRFRLGPDCGVSSGIPAELPAVSGGSRFVQRARLEESAPGEVAVTLSWARSVAFVAAPMTSARGLRVRLLDALPGKRGRLLLDEQPDAAVGYSINLDSAQREFTPADLADAAAYLKLPTYVSKIELESTIWYRLRAGPIATRRDAERALTVARQKYARAWLGIHDEDVQGPATAVPAAVLPTVPTDPPLPQADRERLLREARAALAQRKYASAVQLLTQLTRQPEYPQREQAQELLGIAHERSGQVAHAKAEYEEYLRRYPQGSAGSRVRIRLRALASAARAARTGTRGDGAGRGEAWTLSGGASQFYRWERSRFDSAGTVNDTQAQNAIYTDGDFVARRRGERFDFVTRVTAGFAKDLLTAGPGDQTRVSSAFVELNDRERGIAGRLGRQSRNSGGLLGTFDGAFVSYQLRPRLTFTGAAGFPVESTRDSPATDRQFVGLAAEFGPFNEQWDFGVFAVNQQISGETDRRALGLEARYFVPGRSVVALLDYDVLYQAINSAVLMGNVQLPARWTVSFNLDHRLAPVLSTRNALTGQPVRSYDELLTLFTAEEIRRLAEDRTPLTDIYSLSISRPLAERFQFTVDAFASRVDATPSSGGVPATPATGLDRTLQLQLQAFGLWRSNDLFALTLRRQDSDTSTLDSFGLTTRLPLFGPWRLGPRLRVDRIESRIDAAEQMVYVPGLRLDYQRGRSWFELEASAELGRRDIPAETERTKRYYFGLGYRVSF